MGSPDKTQAEEVVRHQSLNAPVTNYILVERFSQGSIMPEGTKWQLYWG